MRIAILLCLAFFAGLVAGLLVTRLTLHPSSVIRANPDTALIQEQEPRSPPPDSRARVLAGPSLRDALAALPIPTREEGSGVVTGNVRTEDGVPVSGVLVSAVRKDHRRSTRTEKAEASPAADLEREVLELVERRRSIEATRREARTNPQGEFLIERLAAGRYTLEAALDGYEIRHAPGEKPQGVKPGDNVRFLATPSVSVPVIVLLPNSTQPESAKVEHTRRERRGGNPRYADWTPLEPTIRLEPGDQALAAVLGDEGELRSDTMDVTVKAGATTPTVTLRLRQRPGIRGRVIFLPGEELDADVFVLRTESKTAPDYTQCLAAGNGYSARRRDGFRYVFRDRLPGRYVLAATRMQGRIETFTSVEVEDNIVTQDIELPALDPAAHVVLWVHGPHGEVLADVEIRTGCKTDHSSSGGDSAWLRRPDGSFWVLPYGAGACAQKSKDLRHTLTVESRRFGRKEAEYTLPRSEPIVVEFTEPAFLDVTLSGYEGSGHEGFAILGLVETTRDEQGKVISGKSHPPARDLDLLGKARFGPVEPGNYEVLLSLKDVVGPGSYGATGIQSFPITLRPGENAESVPMPGLHSLTVLVESPGADIRINLRQLADGGTYTGLQFNDEPVGEDGRVTFRRLPAGKYKLSTSSGFKDGEMVVRVPEQATVRYEPQPRDAMGVYVSDPAGVLARAGFKTGDLVVGLDGAAFVNEAQMQATLKSAALKEEVKLRVLRGDETLELPFDPRLQDKAEDQLGGFLWATCR